MRQTHRTLTNVPILTYQMILHLKQKELLILTMYLVYLIGLPSQNI